MADLAGTVERDLMSVVGDDKVLITGLGLEHKQFFALKSATKVGHSETYFP